jgi:hypothetical protein
MAELLLVPVQRQSAGNSVEDQMDGQHQIVAEGNGVKKENRVEKAEEIW